MTPLNQLELRRALEFLDRVENPHYLFTYWRAIGKTPAKVPEIEECRPWWEGLEHLIN